MFCNNCGEKIDDASKFCNFCGAKVENKAATKTSFDGEVKKCPRCGEVVNAFDIKCGSCGYEFRDTKTSASLEEFSKKLSAIDEARLKRKDISSLEAMDMKITYIGSFAIPNNKEDILEFMIMASSNIKTQGVDGKNYKHVAAINNAWMAKMEQAYEKAKVSLKAEDEFAQISALYAKKQKEIEKLELLIKFKRILAAFYFIIIIVLIYIYHNTKNDVHLVVASIMGFFPLMYWLMEYNMAELKYKKKQNDEDE